jgi:hypothetical protein
MSEIVENSTISKNIVQYNIDESLTNTVIFSVKQLYTFVETLFNENLKLNELISFNYLITELTEMGSILESSTPIIAYIMLFIGFAVGIIFVLVGLRDLGVQI